jgi:hypothetical protein
MNAGYLLASLIENSGGSPAGGGTSLRDDQVSSLLCCSFSRNQLRNSRVAFGCGESLKVAAVCAHTGVGSIFENEISTGLPARCSTDRKIYPGPPARRS